MAPPAGRGQLSSLPQKPYNYDPLYIRSGRKAKGKAWKKKAAAALSFP